MTVQQMLVMSQLGVWPELQMAVPFPSPPVPSASAASAAALSVGKGYCVMVVCIQE